MCEPGLGVPALDDLTAALGSLPGGTFVIVEQDLYPCDFDRPYPIAARTRKTLQAARNRVNPMSKHVTVTVAVAVVGAGMAGQAHAFGYRNATMHPGLAGTDVQLAAIVDYNGDLAASAAARYGFAAAATDLDAVLRDDAIDAVSLALDQLRP